MHGSLVRHKLTVILLATIMVFLILPISGLSEAASISSDEMVGLNSVGEMVVRVQLRLRELGYLNFKPTGNFRSMTVNATIAFQTAQSNLAGSFISADGSVGPQTQNILFSVRATRAAIPANVSMPIGPGLNNEPAVKGELLAWSDVKELLQENTTYTITDYNTGATFSVRYISGDGHAEVEPASVEDTEIFLEAFGGVYNYSKRPVVVSVNGRQIAASLFGHPHGDDAVANNDMDGHTCLYFDDSTSNVGNLYDIEHQKQVYAASGS